MPETHFVEPTPPSWAVAPARTVPPGHARCCLLGQPTTQSLRSPPFRGPLGSGRRSTSAGTPTGARRRPARRTIVVFRRCAACECSGGNRGVNFGCRASDTLYNGVQYEPRGFVWRDGVIRPLPTLGGNNEAAFGVAKDEGQIVGMSETGKLARPLPTPRPRPGRRHQLARRDRRVRDRQQRPATPRVLGLAVRGLARNRAKLSRRWSNLSMWPTAERPRNAPTTVRGRLRLSLGGAVTFPWLGAALKNVWRYAMKLARDFEACRRRLVIPASGHRAYGCSIGSAPGGRLVWMVNPADTEPFGAATRRAG